MIVAVEIGRKNSIGFPNKNKYKIGDHPMLAYPLMAAEGCKDVDAVFYSTDDPEQADMAKYYGAEIIERPAHLATKEALGEDVFVHALDWIEEEFNNEIEFIVTLFASAPCVIFLMMTEMVDMLRKNIEADSICSVSKYNMFSPYRARKMWDIWTMPFSEELLKDKINCDRDSGESTYIYDISCAVVRPYCLKHLRDGIKPMRWLGRRVLGYNKYNDIPRCDVDYSWQLGQIKCWLDKYWKGK